MNILNKLFKRNQFHSKDIAKDRLKLVLVHDRIDFSPGKMEQLKYELLEVISRYVEVDYEHVELAVTNIQRQSCLTAQVSVLGAAQ
jgi:cell division topological specificity factor